MLEGCRPFHCEGTAQTRGSMLISPVRTLVTKDLHELCGKTSAGPFLSLESRTPTRVGSSAASMQLLPVPSL